MNLAARLFLLHALSANERYVIFVSAYLMRVLPRIIVYSPGIQLMYSGAFFVTKLKHILPHIRLFQKSVVKRSEITMSNIYRDRTLNQVSEQDIDSNLRVAGWVEYP